MTITQTKSITNTKVAVAVGLLLLSGGAAAFAAFGMPQEKLFSSLSVKCQDGSRLITDQYMETVYRSATGTPEAGPGRPCFTSREAQNIAAAFCGNARNPVTGKVGVNTFSVHGKCEQAPQKPNYGYAPYGYGYGYGYQSSKK